MQQRAALSRFLSGYPGAGLKLTKNVSPAAYSGITWSSHCEEHCIATATRLIIVVFSGIPLRGPGDVFPEEQGALRLAGQPTNEKRSD
ncbi:MAG: hypothetical protein AB1442_02170 [Nitrospirota bacterium]